MLSHQIIPLAHSLRSNACVSMCLQPLELSCLSFCNNLPLFSVAYSLFCQNTGGAGTSRCGPAPRPSRFRSCTRFVSPFPATHPKKEPETHFLPSVNPFAATHTETPSYKSFPCHTSKNRGVSLPGTHRPTNSEFTHLRLARAGRYASLFIGSSGTGRYRGAGQPGCRYYPGGEPGG
jgi:hypothetical protein